MKFNSFVFKYKVLMDICFNKPNAYLEVISGCMMSGKSTELLRKIRRAEAAQYTTIVIGSAMDSRSNGKLKTHDKHSRPCISVTKLMDLTHPDHTHFSDLCCANTVAIDEGQLFDDLVDFVYYLLQHNKYIYVAGLVADKYGYPFENMLTLVPLSDQFYKLSAICVVCGNDAYHTRQTIADEGRQVTIGGADKYEAVCRQHWTPPPIGSLAPPYTEDEYNEYILEPTPLLLNHD